MLRTCRIHRFFLPGPGACPATAARDFFLSSPKMVEENCSLFYAILDTSGVGSINFVDGAHLCIATSYVMRHSLNIYDPLGYCRGQQNDFVKGDFGVGLLACP